MKRRQAIQSIAAVTSAIVLLPSCEFESGPVYANLPLESSQKKLIEQLSDAVLPKGNLEINTRESTLNFLLTIINDCYSPEDIEKYVLGLGEFQNYIDQSYNRSFKKLNEENKSEVLNYLSKSENRAESMKYFYNTTKRLTVQHFTTSEYFLTTYLDFEYMPYRYHGCVNI